MTRPQLNARSPFDAFLFATMGEDSKGLVGSVLSALARLDFEPWQEAVQTRLAAMIADLPNWSPLQRSQPPSRPRCWPSCPIGSDTRELLMPRRLSARRLPRRKARPTGARLP
ncbi:hypothetical protein Acry_3199 (plasmid) [Acidiphilium cryptum JF-5]|uniref:Uncharacterized protein n=1 Tax=Acidiphilium cryptum (strain JF-5) TaxID=349163 RepID=A5FT89_ACICJ|nr:hypothetical protein Acry_3199 [Acidiphilium cryptum JF-5]